MRSLFLISLFVFSSLSFALPTPQAKADFAARVESRLSPADQFVDRVKRSDDGAEEQRQLTYDIDLQIKDVRGEMLRAQALHSDAAWQRLQRRVEAKLVSLEQHVAEVKQTEAR